MVTAGGAAQEQSRVIPVCVAVQVVPTVRTVTLCVEPLAKPVNTLPV